MPYKNFWMKMTKTLVPYVLRGMDENDKAFIYTTWIKVHWTAPPMNFCDKTSYLPHQREVITKLLDTANVLVACDPDDSDSLLGYIVYEFVAGVLIVHWLHIKSINRFMHLASDILETIYPNHRTRTIICTQNFMEYSKLRYKFKLSYDPFFLMDRMRGIH